MENVALGEISKREQKQCYFCGETCTEDAYCFGCKTYICDKCNWNDADGNHAPEDHQEES